MNRPVDIMEEKVRQFLEANYKDAVIREDNFRDQQSFYVDRDYIFELLDSLRGDRNLEFNLLADICSLDWMGQPEEKEGRFEVIYNLYSIKNKYRLLIKVRLSGDDPVIDTVTPIWHTANWLEREVWDMMGIKFSGHPNLIKIVTPDFLDGHPLRKDFPLTYEVPRFSYNMKEPPEVIK